MRTSVAASWTLSLADGERFEISGSPGYLAPESTVLADVVKVRYGSQVELTGFAKKKNGEYGEARRRVVVDLEDARIPDAVHREIARMSGLVERFISKAQS